MVEAGYSASLVKSPWAKCFERLLSAASEDLLLVAPFVKKQITTKISSELANRGLQGEVHVTLLSNLRPDYALNGSLDLEGLAELGSALRRFDLFHLPSLHAKVYVADRKMAVVTSGNLTDGGLTGNLEYGAVFTGEAIVRQIRSDFEEYRLLGTRVLPDEVATLVDEIRELKLLLESAQKTIRARARRAFREKLGSARLRILRYQARGKTTQGILCSTILYLLAQRPLLTVELHPLIQRLQPDLCDDSIDRVIEGVHFGKKWKHHVRSAQQFLKRHGRIRYDGTRWHLVPGAAGTGTDAEWRSGAGLGSGPGLD